MLSFFLVTVGCYHLCYHLMLSFIVIISPLFSFSWKRDTLLLSIEFYAYEWSVPLRKHAAWPMAIRVLLAWNNPWPTWHEWSLFAWMVIPGPLGMNDPSWHEWTLGHWEKWSLAHLVWMITGPLCQNDPWPTRHERSQAHLPWMIPVPLVMKYTWPTWNEWTPAYLSWTIPGPT
jgi:hypothetical protein